MNDKLQQIAPRKMTDIKQLQDGLVMVINLFEQQLTINEEQRKEIQRLFFDLRQLTGSPNGDILIEALESLNSKYEV